MKISTKAFIVAVLFALVGVLFVVYPELITMSPIKIGSTISMIGDIIRFFSFTAGGIAFAIAVVCKIRKE